MLRAHSWPNFDSDHVISALGCRQKSVVWLGEEIVPTKVLSFCDGEIFLTDCSVEVIVRHCQTLFSNIFAKIPWAFIEEGAILFLEVK